LYFLASASLGGQTQVGLRCFIWTTASMSSLLGPFGPGLPLRFDENSRRYLRLLRAWRMLKRVEGFSTMAERIRRAGRMRRTHKPATRHQKSTDWVTAAARDCGWSCCVTSTDSATTERTPPGPKSRATVAMTWTKRTTGFQSVSLQERLTAVILP